MLSSFVSFCLCLTSLAAQTTQLDFSGNWQLDQHRSSSEITIKERVKLPKEPSPDGPPPPPPPPAHGRPATMVIEQRGSQLSLPGWGMFSSKTLRLVTDGKEQINDFGAEGKHRSKTVWQDNQLVVDWVHEDEAGAVLMKGQDRLSLAADGQTLQYDKRATHIVKGTVDGHPFENEITLTIHWVMSKAK
jgi:hypothetical protein